MTTTPDTAGVLRLLRELHALVQGECPSLLDEDSGGDVNLAMRIDDALTHPSSEPKLEWLPIEAAPEPSRNQCDGCLQGAPVTGWLHRDKHGRAFMACEAERYTTPQTASSQPVAWMTHHDEPMFFSTQAEAVLYCDDDEEPIPLLPQETKE